MPVAAFVYMPVIHAGYLAWVEAQRVLGRDLFLLSEEFAEEIDIRRKDLRALPAALVASLLGSERHAGVFTRANAALVLAAYERFVFADEDVSDHVIAALFDARSVERVPVFLRYDRKRSLAHAEVTPDKVVASDPTVSAIMARVLEEGKRSSDWYIQVGAALVRDGVVELIAHNEHGPSPNVVDALGSVRANFTQGVHIELSTALHAEGALLAEAVRRGISFSGCDLYTSTFPCPYCAPIIARSGLKRLYYSQGYAMIDGEASLRTRGIEIVRVAI